MPASPAPARRSAADVALLAEALIALTVASAAVRFLPVRRIARLASLRGGRPRRAASPEAAAKRVRWAVEAWARRVPWRAVCFQIGLAAHWMLRRRGLPSRLHYGVGAPSEELSAHVWVTLDDRPVVGEFEAGLYATLAVFPQSG